MNELGITQAVVPIFPFPLDARPAAGEDFMQLLGRIGREMGVDGWKRTADLLNKSGETLKKEGIKLGYHNHNVEFAPVGNTTGWDVLIAQTDPKLVNLELDVGWVAAAGIDPIAEVRRLKGRVALMHVKDIKATTKPNFVLRQDPTEVGSGMIDWKKLLPAAYAAGVRKFYIEQEPPFTMDRFDAVAKSRAYLSSL